MATSASLQGWLTPAIGDGAIYSDGWRRAGGPPIEVLDKTTGDVLAAVGSADGDDVARATASAAAAQSDWRHAAARERVEVLVRAAAIIGEHAEEISNGAIAEVGAIARMAHGGVATSLAELRSATAWPVLPRGEVLEGGVAERVPVGVVGVINPWNSPFFFAWRALAPALALGNAVVLKPDPNTPITGGLMVAQILEEAGLPEGLFHVLPGGAEIGKAIVSDRNVAMISFTGSSGAGLAIAQAAGLKRTQLELGGNNAFIVLDDADVDAAASSGAFSSFINQGQGCICAGRHLVHESLVERYTEGLVERAKALKVGDPRDPAVDIGPIINERQIERIEGLVEESVAAGARPLTGARRDGVYYAPTVLNAIELDMPVYREEVFGPVAPIISFSTDDEAIELANDTDYGLVAAVHSGSADRGLAVGEQLVTGMLHVNGHTVADSPAAPFGGLGASGNGTRFGGTGNLEAFTEWRWTTVHTTPPPTLF
jgi:benzaldehyde dehydrogenase (NAD)